MRKNYYAGLAADYSSDKPVGRMAGDKIIKKALTYKQASVLPPLPADKKGLKKIEIENKEWWPSHCEALRRRRGDILTAEYRSDLVYFCQDGPFYGRGASVEIEKSWWKLISNPEVFMTWPIVMFYGEVVYFEWVCRDKVTHETTAKGNAVFLRRGHAGGIHVKVEQLTFYRHAHEKFFSECPG